MIVIIMVYIVASVILGRLGFTAWRILKFGGLQDDAAGSTLVHSSACNNVSQAARATLVHNVICQALPLKESGAGSVQHGQWIEQ